MSNEKPITCAVVGHCMHPDDTTGTCMRCGIVQINHPAAGLDPAVMRAAHEHNRMVFEQNKLQARAALFSSKPPIRFPTLLGGEPDYETRLRDEVAKDYGLEIMRAIVSKGESSIGATETIKIVGLLAHDYAAAFMTERTKRIKGE